MEKQNLLKNDEKSTPPAIKFKTEETKNGFGHPDVQTTPDITQGMEESYLDTVSEITGTLNEMLGQQLLQQAIQATPGANKIDVTAEAVSAALGEMKPKDAVEGMVVTQMTALHNQMMHYMKLSIEDEWQADVFLSRFLKINRQFLACLKGLLQYRNRGQQNVIVQNFKVEPDGKAFVGIIQPHPGG